MPKFMPGAMMRATERWRAVEITHLAHASDTGERGVLAQRGKNWYINYLGNVG